LVNLLLTPEFLFTLCHLCLYFCFRTVTISCLRSGFSTTN